MVSPNAKVFKMLRTLYSLKFKWIYINLRGAAGVLLLLLLLPQHYYENWKMMLVTAIEMDQLDDYIHNTISGKVCKIHLD